MLSEVVHYERHIEVETPASLDLTRAAAFAIRIVAIAVLVWAIRWW
ncbi:hypothetical protein A3385_004871 [Escherichia coli]|nr:hypothetical protein [Escherichia coli]EFJ5650277.1 hypothetical protein [Escherichia coli]EHH7578342.1 hypothetical protein [Escherichia coli]EJR3930062.1 hypothetical protein [Escherichia coli]HAM9030927.1 hypothetical protein [Escherichia coli]